MSSNREGKGWDPDVISTGTEGSGPASQIRTGFIQYMSGILGEGDKDHHGCSLYLEVLSHMFPGHQASLTILCSVGGSPCLSGVLCEGVFAIGCGTEQDHSESL